MKELETTAQGTQVIASAFPTPYQGPAQPTILSPGEHLGTVGLAGPQLPRRM